MKPTFYYAFVTVMNAALECICATEAIYIPRRGSLKVVGVAVYVPCVASAIEPLAVQGAGAIGFKIENVDSVVRRIAYQTH